MRISIDPNDQNEVIWLQLALSKLLGGIAGSHEVGRLTAQTIKALRLYQSRNDLPITGEPDTATLQHIQQALERT